MVNIYNNINYNIRIYYLDNNDVMFVPKLKQKICYKHDTHLL